MYGNEHSLYSELSISDDETPKVTRYPHQQHFFTAYQANKGDREPSQTSALPFVGNAKLMTLLRQPRPEAQAARPCLPWRKKKVQLAMSDLSSDVINHILSYLLDEPRSLAALAGTSRFLLQQIIQSMDTEASERIYPLLEIIRKSGLNRWLSEGYRKNMFSGLQQGHIVFNDNYFKYLYHRNMSERSIDTRLCGPCDVKSLVLQLEHAVKLHRRRYDYCSEHGEKAKRHAIILGAFLTASFIVSFILLAVLDSMYISFGIFSSAPLLLSLYLIISRCANHHIGNYLNKHYDIDQIIDGARSEIQERNRQLIRQEDTADETYTLSEAVESDDSDGNSRALSRGSLFTIIEWSDESYADDDNDSMADESLNASSSLPPS